MIEKQANGRYKATLVKDGKRHPLGTYGTRELAEAALAIYKADPTRIRNSAKRNATYTVDNETLSPAEWGAKAGVPPNYFHMRAKRHACTIEEAIAYYLAHPRKKKRAP